MRLPSSKQSALRYPLSAILASEGNVRVLRELLRHGGALNAPHVARRVGMSPQHVRQILASLHSVGVIEEVGQGRYVSYRAGAGHPLYRALDDLFRKEDERFDAVLSAVREASAASGAVPLAVWLYGSVARGEDTAESDVDIAVVMDDAVLEKSVERIRERLHEAENRLGVSFSVVGLTPEDVGRLSAGDPWWADVQSDALALVGADPDRLAAQLRRARRPAEVGEKE